MNPTWTRRGFLGLGGLTAGAVLLGCTAGSDSTDIAATTGPASTGAAGGAERHDVIVVGGGLAGLSTARNLVADGVDVVVVEARTRVGGRTFTLTDQDGVAVEAGGMWVGPGQDAILDLAGDLGIDTFANPTGGDLALVIGGERLVVPPGRGPETEATFDQIDALAAGLPPGRPWDSPDAAELDAITLIDWLAAEQVPDDAALAVIADASGALGDPFALSMLWFLTVVASAGGLRNLADIEAGAQERRFDGGAQSLSVAMADELGDRVRLGAAVETIETADDRVVVNTTAGSFEAQRVVVAMMPADVGRIAFTPELPPARAGLDDAWVGAPGIKATIRYPRPFWRDAGLSGVGMVDGGTVGGVLDITPPDQDSGWLVAFVESDAPDGADIEDAVVADLTELFGPEAADPTGFFAYDWGNDPWASGCVTTLPPGVLTDFGSALVTPVGRIHWAGTETSEIWTGYMDGAVRSGQRAAGEVLAELS